VHKSAPDAVDGSNFTKGKVERRRRQLEESLARYLALPACDNAGR